MLLDLIVIILRSGLESVLDAYAIGLSEPTSILCAKTAPTPYGVASHDNTNSFSKSLTLFLAGRGKFESFNYGTRLRDRLTIILH
jgi:hypothetical protein